MKFLYTNADQFVNKRDDLVMFITNNEPDVMMITEVIPKNQINPISNYLLQIDGYKMLLNFDPNLENLGASGKRGVAIYSKESLHTIEVKFPIDGFSDHVWIEIPTDKNGRLLCGCIYRSPSDSSEAAVLESTKKVCDLILSAYQSNSNLIIAGDFNFKEIDWENECWPINKSHLGYFIETIQDCYLYQHVSEPTRFRANDVPNLLDLVMSSEEGMIQNVSTHPPLGESDHLVITFNVVQSQHATIGFTPVPNVWKTDYNAIMAELSDVDWNRKLNTSFNEDYEMFINLLLEKLLKYSPLTKSPMKKRNIYMTAEALRLKNAKSRAWKRYKIHQSTHSRNVYVRCKNKLRSLTRSLRKNFERQLTAGLKDKPKTFWKYVATRLKTRHTIPALEQLDGQKATTDEEKAAALNDYFASVFTKEDINSVPPVVPKQGVLPLTSVEISPEVVLKKLKALNPNKSTGHDKIHPHFLRQLADCLATPLSILFKKSLCEGAHESWCKAIITALFKKGNRDQPDNYRPVSITSVISKLMESIVRDEILQHLMTNGILCDNQHGFVPGRNCMTQLMLCMEEWTTMVEENEMFDIIYTDFSKAFDSVAHQRLLVKLENIGIQGDFLYWIRSFLSGRFQRVKLNGQYSNWQRVLSGIPQWSVLGPLLSVIFT